MIPWSVASKSPRKTEPRAPLSCVVLNSELILPGRELSCSPCLFLQWGGGHRARGLQGRPGGGWMGQRWGWAGNALQSPGVADCSLHGSEDATWKFGFILVLIAEASCTIPFPHVLTGEWEGTEVWGAPWSMSLRTQRPGAAPSRQGALAALQTQSPGAKGKGPALAGTAAFCPRDAGVLAPSAPLSSPPTHGLGLCAFPCPQLRHLGF